MCIYLIVHEIQILPCCAFIEDELLKNRTYAYYKSSSRACTRRKCAIDFNCGLFQGWNLIEVGCRLDQAAQKLKCWLILKRVNARLDII